MRPEKDVFKDKIIPTMPKPNARSSFEPEAKPAYQYYRPDAAVAMSSTPQRPGNSTIIPTSTVDSYVKQARDYGSFFSQPTKEQKDYSEKTIKSNQVAKYVLGADNFNQEISVRIIGLPSSENIKIKKSGYRCRVLYETLREREGEFDGFRDFILYYAGRVIDPESMIDSWGLENGSLLVGVSKSIRP